MVALRRGDIIAPGERVIALPGETVQIKDGQILMDMNFRHHKRGDLPPSRSLAEVGKRLCSATTGTTSEDKKASIRQACERARPQRRQHGN